jgi:cellobiose phosphorylase
VGAFVSVAEGLFGIKADFKGLKVDPCIPKSWPGFTATRKYRGVEYQIEVKNPNDVCKGGKSVTVDGKKVAGNVIPYEAGKKIVKVEITLEA